jgi:ubiquinone/menaquinone biosynthesis C-methylase UbiE
LPFYDPIVKLFGGDKARKVLIDQVALQPGHRVLDIGCGTGTLAVLIKREHPDVGIIGIDLDSKALARARHKAARAGVSIQFDQGFGDELPYAEASFDRVISSFVFHHLRAEEKVKTLRAVHRVLKPGGRLHMVDFECPESGAHGLLARLFHLSERMKDNSESRVLNLMTRAGFREPRKVGERPMFSGQIAYFQAVA